jgi:hypothetical protein
MTAFDKLDLRCESNSVIQKWDRGESEEPRAPENVLLCIVGYIYNTR